MRTDGSERTVIVDEEASNLNISGDWIYYSHNDYENDPTIVKVKLDGTERTEIIQANLLFLNVVGDWIFFVSFDHDNQTFDIYKVKTDGSNLEIAK